MAEKAAPGTIAHVFVLMLENRSFDHMLGFSGITGTDAVTGSQTTVDGLTGGESNSASGVAYPVTRRADLVMPVDPSHEFEDVVTQLCGAGAKYPKGGGQYPAVDCSGFVEKYRSLGGVAGTAPGTIMKCYDADQLPVLTALAREFAVCDRWFSSMPGPTWPNRFFIHAGSSGGLDHSPGGPEVALWDTIYGFRFAAGTIFDALDRAGPQGAWRIYAGGDFPNVAALHGVNNFEVRDLEHFTCDVASAGYRYRYTFIEPNYGDVIGGTFRGGNSQHPLDDVTHGEALIKTVYEAIRNSPHWPHSLLVVTWDEHGGFYDHVHPPAAIPPGDDVVVDGANRWGFAFDQYGPRVPAVIVSPLIPRNVIDHREYDHASVPATVQAVFGLPAMTARDKRAKNLISLASLASARTDAPASLPNPAPGASAHLLALMVPPIDGAASIEQGNLPGFLGNALRSDLALSRPEDRAAILTRFKSIATREQAQVYMDEVRVKVRAGRLAIHQNNDREANRGRVP
ncbi:MAG: Phosphoesterase [Phycisphaerales bacterium]|nr:Phosphoesterase [Phycisphaerales bacterium]